MKTPEIVELIAKSNTVDDMVTNMSLFTDKPFKKGETYVFFDDERVIIGTS